MRFRTLHYVRTVDFHVEISSGDLRPYPSQSVVLSFYFPIRVRSSRLFTVQKIPLFSATILKLSSFDFVYFARRSYRENNSEKYTISRFRKNILANDMEAQTNQGRKARREMDSRREIISIEYSAAGGESELQFPM